MLNTNQDFQTFFISRELSNCPLIKDVLTTIKKIEEKKITGKNHTGVISVSYGKRVLINAADTNLKNVSKESLLEIVDYDPVKKNLLVIGIKEPHVETPVHWLIHHARDDVNAIIQLSDRELAKNFSKKLPVTEKEYPPGTLNLAKEVLKKLRTSKSIVLKNNGILFTGYNLKEVEKLIFDTCEEN